MKCCRIQHFDADLPLVHVSCNQENPKNARKFVCGPTIEKQEVEEGQTTHQTLSRHTRQSKSTP